MSSCPIPAEIAVGSTSDIKNSAVRDALDRAHMVSTGLMSAPGSSGVDAQPFGDVTDLGAERRARAALEIYPRVTYAIGIESGLDSRCGRWVDRATVVIMQRASVGATLVGLATSIGLPFPMAAVDACLTRGPELHTAGEYVAEMGGGQPDDPHAALTQGRLTRRKLLADAVYAALIQVWP
jgi:non-canonical (house-cleaning) NTP pyrophosphatase